MLLLRSCVTALHGPLDCLPLSVLDVAPLRGSSGILGHPGCSVRSRTDGSAVVPVGPAHDARNDAGSWSHCFEL